MTNPEFNLHRSKQIAVNTFSLVQKLKENEQWQRDLFNAAPCHIHMKDKDLRYIMASASFCDDLGLTEHNILGRTAEQIYEYLDRHNTEVELNILKEGRAVNLQVSATLRGELRTFKVMKFPMFNLHGEVDRVGTIGIDITSQTLAEREVDRLGHLMIDAFESIPHGFALLNETDGVICCNTAFAAPLVGDRESLYGITIAQLFDIGEKVYQRIRSPTQEVSSKGFMKVWLSMVEGEIPYVELQRRSDERWFLVTSSRSPKGNISLLRIDVTDQKNAKILPPDH